MIMSTSEELNDYQTRLNEWYTWQNQSSEYKLAHPMEMPVPLTPNKNEVES